MNAPVLIVGIVVGLVLGLDPRRLAGEPRRRSPPLDLGSCSLAVIVRFGTEAALDAGVASSRRCASRCSPPRSGSCWSALWANRSFPGLSIAFVGILSNAIAILVNGGYMPIWAAEPRDRRLPPADIHSVFHVIAAAGARRRFPAPSRAARRHHPDPVPGRSRMSRRWATCSCRGPRPSSCSLRSLRPRIRARSAACALGRDPPRPGSRRPSPRAAALQRPLLLGGSSAGNRGPGPRATPAGVHSGRHPGPACPPAACTGSRSSGFGATRTSGSRSTAPSRPVDRPAHLAVRRPDAPGRACRSSS